MHRKMTKFLSLFLSAAMMAGTLSVPVLAEEPVSVYTETLEEETVTDAETFPEEEAEDAGTEVQEAVPEASETAEPETPEEAVETEVAAEAQEETDAEEIPADWTSVTETEAAEADADIEPETVPVEDYAADTETNAGADEAVEDAVPVQETETADVPVEEVVTDPVGDALTGEGYVLMNIPYDAFFEAEGISGVDAVSTATIKTYNQTMAAGSYHAGYDAADPISGAQILGVTYPVYVADLSVLEGLTQITDSDTATITVASGKSSTTTKEVSGQDLLFASGDYAYYVLSEAPANYKTLSGEAGNFSFSAVQTGAVSAEIGSAELTYGGHYTPLTLTVEAGEVEDAAVTGVVLTADGQDYVLRHVENIWRKVSLGWNWTDLDGAGLSGKTITAVTYYMQDGGIYRYAVEIPVKQQMDDFTAAFENANTIKVTGLPEDIQNPKATVSSVVGRGETPVVIADGVDVVDGTLTTAEPAVSGTGYNVVIISDNYADTTVRIAYETMTQVAVGGINYYYTDTNGDPDYTQYQAVVTSRAGSTTYSFAKDDLTLVNGTTYGYTVVPGTTPLSGTLYGYESGSGSASSYKEVYAGLGVSTDSDPAYDAVTSATEFSGHHAKDIPSLVIYGTDAEGEKAITGLTLGRSYTTVDAVTYVEASILKAAEETLTDEQAAAAATVLKVNPMTAPASEEIAVRLSGASFATSRFGRAEFSLVPDDTVEGYVWSEYWNSVYAATISDGTTTAGAVHWIDLYGEAATSGRHYNNLEIALNNGESTGSNLAEVSRYASFFDGDYIKSGTYTITVYAEGYTPLTAEVDVKVELADKTAPYTGEAVSIDEAKLTGIEGETVYTYYEDEACTKPLTGAPVEAGTYYVKAVAADLVTSAAAKLTIENPAPVAVTGVKLDRTSADLTVNKTLQLKATVVPSNAMDQTVTWTSSDPSVATVSQNGLVKAMKYGKVTITAKTANGKSAKCTIQTRFTDVSNSGKSYYTPVYWAVDKGITVVTKAFRPEDTVTRGEFVAFLWRLAGKPKSSAKLSFKDVNSKTKFYDAIRWAVEKGIIKGYGDKTFRPDGTLTRGDTAVMIWRYAGRKNPKTKKSPFSDIKASTADSYKAILWGSENGIIKGSGGKFLKNDSCTRGQVVTFLYRYSSK